ncbi:thiamine phosphate synthase [Desulfonatronum sp. SC1]|uniref:thiamine phosphate synthase n=1 Tax=Desulfonatronum sp. SC1 TaxID=2109626 RepID=UPI000D308F0A|nr:thiamine phosphate synthase [Desulfonatronum sp. SC1]PTN38925.1 thiamine phosphate synthase [Desulfonatronum sp. SC1]
MSNPLHNIDLYCLTSEEHSLGRSNLEVVRAMLDAGIKLIQYREKDKPGRVKLEECSAIRKLTREAGALFLVNDDVAVAQAVDADGVHVGQDDLPVPVVRRLIGPDKIIGLSTHSPDQARAAATAGADYIGVGPIFATKTKKDVCAPVGLEYLEWVTANLSIPFVVIGGIKEHNIGEVIHRGASCVAMITEIVAKPDIAGQIRALRNAMNNTIKE